MKKSIYAFSLITVYILGLATMYIVELKEEPEISVNTCTELKQKYDKLQVQYHALFELSGDLQRRTFELEQYKNRLLVENQELVLIILYLQDEIEILKKECIRW